MRDSPDSQVWHAIEAVCDRYFTQDGRLHEGSPFTRMSLGYERAFGGPGTSNPVGVRRDVRDAYGKSPSLRVARSSLRVVRSSLRVARSSLPGREVKPPSREVKPSGS
ncbi:MAG TPA: DUF2169 domain-containing protein [Polyangiaceae bacterium]|nr:DUF2169 domain-containing protein [Polyangiaceae bacterium]